MLIFSPLARVLVAGALHRAMTTTNIVQSVATPRQWSVTIYGGVQPAAANITANWSLYNDTNVDTLAHFDDPFFYLAQPGNMIQLTTAPSSRNALHTGTGTWAIIWGGIVANVSGGSIPNTRFLVVPVSDQTGAGVVRFSTTSFVSGNPSVIADATLGFNL